MTTLHRHQPNAVIMSDGPASLDGQDLHSRLRREFNVPIITLRSRDIYAWAQAVEYGSYLYLDEAVSDAELVASIHSLIRRYHRQSGSTTDLKRQTMNVYHSQVGADEV